MHDTPEPPAQTPSRLTLHDIFAGSDGLRAGWGLLLFVVLWQSLRYLLYPMLLPMLPHRSDPGRGMNPYRVLPLEAAGLVCVVISTWVLARVEGRRFTDYGLNDSRSFRHFGIGAVWGALLLSVLVLLLHAVGALVFDARQLFGAAVVGYAAIWLFGFVLVGLFEELLFRGYAQYTITRGVTGLWARAGVQRSASIAFWTGAVLTSFYFGFGHGANPGESPIGLIAAGLIGLVFCFSIWRTGSLWWAIGFHAAWDWMESFVYGVGDSGSTVQGHLLATHPAGRALLSGGATGPEGSILILPIIALSACAVLLSRSATGPRTHPPYATSEATAAEDLSLH